MAAGDYHIVLKPQGRAGYVARCLELPGCLSEGHTEAEALRSIQDAIKLYLADVAAEAEEKGARVIQLAAQWARSAKLPSLS